MTAMPPAASQSAVESERKGEAQFKLLVMQVEEDCERLTEVKRFNSRYLHGRYMTALRARYEGDEFRSALYCAGNRALASRVPA